MLPCGLLDQKEVAAIKAKYHCGDRVLLHKINDPYIYIEDGAIGTIKFIDDQGQLSVKWENRPGSTTLIPNHDEFERIAEGV